MILIVDDEQPMRDAIRRSLVKAGYLVHLASDAESAIAFLSTNTPEAVLLDIMLGAMNGWAVAGYMQTVERLRKVQVLIVSGMDPDSIREGAKTYANALSHAAIICGKPLNMPHILNVLRVAGIKQ